MRFHKDPDAVLDYRWDWSAWLAEGETISSHTVTASAGITKDSDSLAAGGDSVTVWLSGGEANVTYEVVCQIVTNQGRTDERTIRIAVGDR